ncbi:orotate phosphoribosyltransferase [Roseibacillus ishigakijimensis]|uniref:Orotate phosphoribosyltransferase n=1 Tax=Roseibacillus ishigakijimensis TaxID=454146 RepID=A0A934RPA9_9BACT|nr:orotate phosphoribosyltransferase [Roseibacillus ishigakijimensis]MBK1835507.1 orotate phosphoribosyltransferase [Roseibacillus ishigakijimensis]
MNARDELKAILQEKSIRTGDFTLASGKKSDFYVDCRVTTMDCRGAILVGEVGFAAVAEKITTLPEKPVAIGGMTMGADPISLAIAMESSRQGQALQMFSVRKEAKKYGTGKRVEGNFKSGDTIILVEDTATTGGSTLKAMDAIEAEGGKVAFVVILVDREEGAKEVIEERGVEVVSIYRKGELIA